MITTANPSGTITNSDLELAGTIAHAGTLAHHRDIRECTVAIFSDNTPAVVWGTKASTTTTGPAAYLLRTASLHQRRHRYLLQHAYIPGPANVLADLASRRFDLSDDALLRLLTTLSPHAQNWRMLTTSPELVSQLTCNLLRIRPDRPYLRNAPAPSISSGPTTGCHTRNRWVWTPSYPLWRTKSLTSESSRTASDQGPPAAVVSRSGLHAYVTKSSPLRRVSPTWVSPTRASRLLDSWTLGSPGCTPPTHTKTQHHIASNPSRSRSSTTPMPPSMPPPQPSSPRPWRWSGSPSFSCCARVNTAVLRTTNPCAWAMSPSLLATRNSTPSRRPALTCTAPHMFPSHSTTRRIAKGARSLAMPAAVTPPPAPFTPSPVGASPSVGRVARHPRHCAPTPVAPAVPP